MAGSFLPPVIVELIADARKFNAGTAQAVGGLKKLGDAGSLTGAQLKVAGQKVASGIIAAGVALAAVSVKMASDFEGSMTRLVTGAGEAQKNIKMIHDGILEMGGQVGKTPKELADGMYYIGSAGFHGSEGLKVLKAAAEGAAVGGADMMVVADGLTTALTNYGLGADKATGVTSGLIRAVSLGKTTLPEFSGALGKVLPIAANMGISLSEATAALSTMTASGMKADVAAESLRAMMTALISPTQEGAKVLAMIGLNGQKVSDMIQNPRVGLHGTLQTIGDLLGKKLPGQTALQNQAFQLLTGGITGTTSRLLITGKHFKTFVENIAAVTTSVNGAKDQVLGFNKTQETMAQKLAELKGAGSSILVGIGQALLPTAKNLADWALGAIAFFKRHPLISEIAKDSTLTLFGLAVAAKMKMAVQGLASLFGFGKAAAQLIATRLNTVALSRLTIAMGALGGKLLGGEALGAGVLGAEALGAGAVEGAVGVGLVAAAAPFAAAFVAIAAVGLGSYWLSQQEKNTNTPEQTKWMKDHPVGHEGTTKPKEQLAGAKYSVWKGKTMMEYKLDKLHFDLLGQEYLKEGHTMKDWMAGRANIRQLEKTVMAKDHTVKFKVT